MGLWEWFDGLRERFEDWWLERIRREDRPRWAAADSLAGVADLTALWLEGRLASHPGYGGGPDSETTGEDGDTPDLVPVLAGLNRAGFLTDCSQPGIEARGCDGRWWRQCAAVSGYAEQDTLARITQAVAGSELLLVTRPPAGTKPAHRDRRGVVVTTVDGSPYTQFGVWLSASDLQFQYQGTHAAGVAAVCAAHQVTVIDPVWGRNDTLWPLLDRFAQVID